MDRLPIIRGCVRHPGVGGTTAPQRRPITCRCPDRVAFDPGDALKAVVVTIVGDTRDESSEKFYLRLWSATGAVIADGSGTATFVNDD